mgnify:CR=1 FL=1
MCSIYNISGDIVDISGNFVNILRRIRIVIAANLQELAAVLSKFSGEIVKFGALQEGYFLAAILLKYSGEIFAVNLLKFNRVCRLYSVNFVQFNLRYKIIHYSA